MYRYVGSSASMHSSLIIAGDSGTASVFAMYSMCIATVLSTLIAFCLWSWQLVVLPSVTVLRAVCAHVLIINQTPAGHPCVCPCCGPFVSPAQCALRVRVCVLVVVQEPIVNSRVCFLASVRVAAIVLVRHI